MKKVMVVMGGFSSERDVSLETGKSVVKALQKKGYDVVPYDLTTDISAFVHELDQTKPDVVFNALHGRYGEDGNIQGLLNLLRIPYTHSGVLASSIGMNKKMAKVHFRAAGLPLAKDRIVTFSDIKSGNTLPYPYVVKPINEGSSVGVYIIESIEDKELMIQSWPFGGSEVMMEEYIRGREITVGVLGDQVLGSVEMIPKSGFYDYANKYTDGKTEHLVPAPLSPELAKDLSHHAIRAHKVLGCRGVTRTDFRVDDLNKSKPPKIVILEINTQPGMTALSLVPEMAKSAGIPFEDLVSFLVEGAQCEN